MTRLFLIFLFLPSVTFGEDCTSYSLANVRNVVPNNKEAKDALKFIWKLTENNVCKTGYTMFQSLPLPLLKQGESLARFIEREVLDLQRIWDVYFWRLRPTEVREYENLEDESEKFNKIIDEKFARFENFSLHQFEKLDHFLMELTNVDDDEDSFVVNLNEPFILNSERVLKAFRGFSCTFLQSENGDEFESYRRNFEDNLREGYGFDKVEVEGRSLKNLVDTVRQLLRNIITESLNSLNEAQLKLFFYLKIIYE